MRPSEPIEDFMEDLPHSNLVILMIKENIARISAVHIRAEGYLFYP
jgi:hypothetical protein